MALFFEKRRVEQVGKQSIRVVRKLRERERERFKRVNCVVQRS